MATASVVAIIHDRQALHHASIGGPVEHEVSGPHVVGSLRAHQGLSVGHGDLLPPSPSDLQLGFGVQALDAFMVDPMNGLSQLQIDHLGPVATVPVGEGNDAPSERHIRIWGGLVSQRRRTHAHHREGTSLTQTLCRHVPHQQATSWCGYHFFRNASRVTLFSSSDSARSFFSRLFSTLSSFKRLASETFMPPNLLRQR